MRTRKFPRELKKIYTCYKGEEYITEGTAEECAKAMGLTLSSFRSSVCRSQKGIVKKYTYIIWNPWEVEDEECE